MDNAKQGKFVKSLRTNQTSAENMMWYHIRNRQLNGLKFRRQVPIGIFIVNFICFEKKLSIEIDGGHHNEEQNIQTDQERTHWLEKSGYKVLRFWNNEVLKNIDGVVEGILQNC